MRNVLKGCVTLTAILVCAPLWWSQTRQSGQAARADTGKTMVDQLSKNGDGGPAPKRDLVGFWAGPSSARLNEVPPMTPWGETSRSGRSRAHSCWMRATRSSSVTVRP